MIVRWKRVCRSTRRRDVGQVVGGKVIDIERVLAVSHLRLNVGVHLLVWTLHHHLACIWKCTTSRTRSHCLMSATNWLSKIGRYIDTLVGQMHIWAESHWWVELLHIVHIGCLSLASWNRIAFLAGCYTCSLHVLLITICFLHLRCWLH